MIGSRRQLHKLPIWLGVALCFAIPSYAQLLWGAPPDDVHWLLLLVGTVFLSVWLSVPQILMVLLMPLTKTQITRWALLALSVGATAWVAKLISYPFQTASSMATAHVMAPIYAAMIIGAGGAAVFAAEWLVWRFGKA